MTKKDKLVEHESLSNGIFDSPERMAQELDSLLYFLQSKYTNRKSDILSVFGFIVTEVEVIFSGSYKFVKLQSDLASNTLYICAPNVLKDEEESRRIYLLNAFSDVIKRNQISALVELLRYMKPEAKEKLAETFTAFCKSKTEKL